MSASPYIHTTTPPETVVEIDDEDYQVELCLSTDDRHVLILFQEEVKCNGMPDYCPECEACWEDEISPDWEVCPFCSSEITWVEEERPEGWLVLLCRGRANFGHESPPPLPLAEERYFPCRGAAEEFAEELMLA